MRIEVEVTQVNIEAGNLTTTSDPIALAIRRALEMDAGVAVGMDRIYIDAGSPTGFEAGQYPLPPSVREFVNRFDRREPVRPFRFPLDDGEGG